MDYNISKKSKDLQDLHLCDHVTSNFGLESREELRQSFNSRLLIPE